MTQEEKARAYDIALDKIKRLLGTGSNCSREELEHVFPELAESEDEKIRKSIIELLNEVHFTFKYYDINKMLAWLEKQGKQNEEINEISYRIGIKRVLDNPESYGLEKKCEQKPPIEKLPFEMKTPEESLGIDSDTYSKIVDECIYGEQKPAESIKEYDFHGIKIVPKFTKGDTIKDKKRGEVSTIRDFSYDTGLYTHTYGQFPITIQDNYEIIEQKPWSEEDKRKIDRIYSVLRQAADTHAFSTTCRLIGDKECIELQDFLKSLKERVQPQPKQEWSEEDRKLIDETCDLINTLASGYGEKVTEPISFSGAQQISNIKTRLRSLVEPIPQDRWKPTDDQMEYLAKAITTLGDEGNCKTASILNDLRVELKKLRGE